MHCYGDLWDPYIPLRELIWEKLPCPRTLSLSVCDGGRDGSLGYQGHEEGSRLEEPSGAAFP